MDTKNRFKKTQAVVPTTIEEAGIVVREIGQLQFQINEIEAEVKNQITELQNQAKKAVVELMKNQANAVAALHAFATKNKLALAPTTKTIACQAGTFGWRTNTPTVALTLPETKIIELLIGCNLKQYIRIKESLDKEKMLKERPVVAGVTYQQREEFFVKPKSIPKKTKTVTSTVDK